MILTCIILKIKAQLNQLVNWKLWVALFYPEQSVEFDKICTSISGPRVAPKENSLKKFTEANFSNLVSYLLYTYEKKSTERL